jgi:hypothetical protein
MLILMTTIVAPAAILAQLVMTVLLVHAY